MLQRGRGQVLFSRSHELRARVWTSSQAGGVRQNQQVCRLAEDESDSISVCCTQTEHKTDLSSAQCCSDAALNHPYSLSAINITAIYVYQTV